MAMSRTDVPIVAEPSGIADLVGPSGSDTEYEEVSVSYYWLVLRRRFVVALCAGAAGLVSLLLGWLGVSGTYDVSSQLAYLASGGLLGLFLLGIAAVAFWGEQGQQQLLKLVELEDHVLRLEAALAGLSATSPDRAPGDGSRAEPSRGRT
jgi:hypothetical protein